MRFVFYVILIKNFPYILHCFYTYMHYLIFILFKGPIYLGRRGREVLIINFSRIELFVNYYLQINKFNATI